MIAETTELKELCQHYQIEIERVKNILSANEQLKDEKGESIFEEKLK